MLDKNGMDEQTYGQRLKDLTRFLFYVLTWNYNTSRNEV